MGKGSISFGEQCTCYDDCKVDLESATWLLGHVSLWCFQRELTEGDVQKYHLMGWKSIQSQKEKYKKASRATTFPLTMPWTPLLWHALLTMMCWTLRNHEPRKVSHPLHCFCGGFGHSDDNTKTLGSLPRKMSSSLFNLRQTLGWNSTFTPRECSRDVSGLKHVQLRELSSTLAVEMSQHGFYKPLI